MRAKIWLVAVLAALAAGGGASLSAHPSNSGYVAEVGYVNEREHVVVQNEHESVPLETEHGVLDGDKAADALVSQDEGKQLRVPIFGVKSLLTSLVLGIILLWMVVSEEREDLTVIPEKVRELGRAAYNSIGFDNLSRFVGLAVALCQTGLTEVLLSSWRRWRTATPTLSDGVPPLRGGFIFALALYNLMESMHDWSAHTVSLTLLALGPLMLVLSGIHRAVHKRGIAKRLAQLSHEGEAVDVSAKEGVAHDIETEVAEVLQSAQAAAQHPEIVEAAKIAKAAVEVAAQQPEVAKAAKEAAEIADAAVKAAVEAAQELSEIEKAAVEVLEEVEEAAEVPDIGEAAEEADETEEAAEKVLDEAE